MLIVFQSVVIFEELDAGRSRTPISTRPARASRVARRPPATALAHATAARFPSFLLSTALCDSLEGVAGDLLVSKYRKVTERNDTNKAFFAIQDD